MGVQERGYGIIHDIGHRFAQFRTNICCTHVESEFKLIVWNLVWNLMNLFGILNCWFRFLLLVIAASDCLLFLLAKFNKSWMFLSTNNRVTYINFYNLGHFFQHCIQPVFASLNALIVQVSINILFGKFSVGFFNPSCKILKSE
jgi:hypothetical protein